jgi:hypothetical protein
MTKEGHQQLIFEIYQGKFSSIFGSIGVTQCVWLPPSQAGAITDQMYRCILLTVAPEVPST